MTEEFSFASQYYFFASAYGVVSLLLFLAMLTQLNENFGRRDEVVVFRTLILTSMVSTLSGTIYNLGMGGFIPYPYWLNVAANELDLVGTLSVCYFWFRMTNQKNGCHYFSRRPLYWMTFLPYLMVLILDVASIGFGYTFTVLPDGSYVRGPFYSLQVLTCSLFYLLASVLCAEGYVRGTVAEQALYGQMFLFSLFPIFGGIAQVVIGHYPFTHFAMLVYIFYTFILLQNQRINTDAMTGLNNKFCTHQYVERMIQSADTTPFYRFMLDLNYFKSVNDTYGHLAGDQALVLVGDALRRISVKNNGFIGRFGGDEFTVIVQKKNCKDPDRLATELNALL